MSRCAEIDSTMPDYRHEGELQTLTSEAMMQALNANGLKTIAFSDL
jgi:predicted glycoside hydrolase/deacetylase ChbG (UPF0249 family)